MSEDSIPAVSDSASADTPAPAKSARRASNPRPKKTAKKAAAESASESQAVEPAVVTEAPAAPAPVRDESPAANEASTREEAGHRGSWPEPETIHGEAHATGGKRKRRRKKKGGNAQANQIEVQPVKLQTPGSEGASLQAPARSAQPQPQPAPQLAPRVPLDLEEVSQKAWKIYLAEVSEEGLALIGDNDARDLTRRSFRLAEIFLEEKARRSR